MTLLLLVQQIADTLETAATNKQISFGHGTTNAFDEAAWLTLWRLGYPLDALDALTEQELSAEQVALVQTLAEQRIASGKPLAYLTREAWLQGLSFYVDERVIVPRSLIAECIADANIDPWLAEDCHAVLDLCTGNGSLAILAALTYPEIVVDAVDISPDALAVAQINLERYDLTGRVQLIESDGLQKLQKQYDLILCNPPYVNQHSMDALPAEYRAEPALALAAGVDGMDFIRPMMALISQYLKPEGVLVLEIGHEQLHFEAAFPDLEPIWLETSAGENQVLLLTRDMLSPADVSHPFINT